MSASTCSNRNPRVSTRSVVSAQYMNASSGSGTVSDTDVQGGADASTARPAADARTARRRIPSESKRCHGRSPLYTRRVAQATLSDAIQHYLREIYKLGVANDRVSTTALAREMGVSPASASAMVKKLAALALVEHAPYRGVSLTAEGEQVALEVIRHHRLLELYLAETLGIARRRGARRGRPARARALRGARGSDRRGARLSRPTTRTATRSPTRTSSGRPSADAVSSDTIRPMALKDLFSSLFQRSAGEERVAQYVIREHERGRPLAEILEDRYVVNRLQSPQQRARLLDRPEIVHAIGMRRRRGGEGRGLGRDVVARGTAGSATSPLLPRAHGSAPLAPRPAKPAAGAAAPAPVGRAPTPRSER